MERRYEDNPDDARARMASRCVNFDDDGDRDERGSTGHGNTHVPYGICKALGISLPKNATPKQAWAALKGRGVDPDSAYASLNATGSINDYVKQIESGEKRAPTPKTPKRNVLTNKGLKKVSENSMSILNKEYDFTGKINKTYSTIDAVKNRRLTPKNMKDALKQLSDAAGDAVSVQRTAKFIKGKEGVPDKEFTAFRKAVTEEADIAYATSRTAYMYLSILDAEQKTDEVVGTGTTAESKLKYINTLEDKIKREKSAIVNTMQYGKEGRYTPEMQKYITSAISPEYERIEKKLKDMKPKYESEVAEHKKQQEAERKAKQDKIDKYESGEIPTQNAISKTTAKTLAVIEKLKKTAVGNRKKSVQTVYKSGNKQVYSNGYTAVRFDKPIVDNPTEPGEEIQNIVTNIMDKAAKAEKTGVGFTQAELTECIKSVRKNPDIDKMKGGDFKIVTGKSGKETYLCSAKRLSDTMSALKNPKAYVVNIGSMPGTIYVKGDDGDAVLCPIRASDVYDCVDVKQKRTLGDIKKNGVA